MFFLLFNVILYSSQSIIRIVTSHRRKISASSTKDALRTLARPTASSVTRLSASCMTRGSYGRPPSRNNSPLRLSLQLAGPASTPPTWPRHLHRLRLPPSGHHTTGRHGMQLAAAAWAAWRARHRRGALPAQDWPGPGPSSLFRAARQREQQLQGPSSM
jgi:hypothetical protein